MNLINGNNINYLLKLAPVAMGQIIEDYDISTYMSSSTRFGFILYDLYFVFNIIIATMLYRLSNIISINKSQSDFLYMNYQANLYSIIYIPLVMFNVTFFRFTLINCNFNFIALAMVMRIGMRDNSIFKSKNWAYCIFALIGFTVLWWILRENIMWFFEALIANIFN